jgi:peroxiredoxin
MNNALKIIGGILVAVIILFFALQAIAKFFVPVLEEDVGIVDVGKTPAELAKIGVPSVVLSDLDGKQVNVIDMLGKPMVFVFWATWNSDSVDQMVALNSYYGEKGNVPAGLFVLASQQGKVTVSSFIKRGGYTLPIFTDESGAVGEALAVRNLPTTVFINAKGYIERSAVGSVSVGEITNWLAGNNK